jgi:hypothetical protein
MAILGIVQKIIRERLDLEAKEKDGEAKVERHDMLAQYLEIQRSNPSVPAW